jgi:hypothetical protein
MNHEEYYKLVKLRDKLKKRAGQLAESYEKAHKVLVRREQKKRQPRARKRFKDLDLEIKRELAAPLLRKLHRLYASLDAGVRTVEHLLVAYADGVAFPPQKEFILVMSRSTYDFHTQGLGASTYAKGRLELEKACLEKYGFRCEIREERTGKSDRWGIRPMKYELWANCPAGVLEARKYWKGLTLDEMFVVSKTKGALNLRVYSPALCNYWESEADRKDRRLS